MERFTYENQGINTYLVCEISNENVDTMSLGMLTNNRIPGFAPAIYTQLNESKYVKYNISAKISMQQFFMGVVGRTRLLKVFHGIACALMVAEEYMIDTRAVILETDHIYVNVSTCETEIICVPVMIEQDVQADYGMFFKNIMFSTQFDKNENCNYVAVLINYLNSTPVFSILDFRKILEDLLEEGKQEKESVQPKVSPVVEPKMEQAPVDTVRTPLQVQSQVQSSNPPKAQTVTQQAPAWNTGMKSEEKGSTSFAVPKEKKSTVQKTEAEEKNISMFYLLQHYNKENAAAYKAQRNAKKAEKIEEDKKKMKTKPEKTKPEKGKGVQNSYGYAIPGMQTQVNSTVTDNAQAVRQTELQQNVQLNVQSNTATTISSIGVAPNSVVNNTYGLTLKSANFGETTVLGAGTNGLTTVLSMAVAPTSRKPYLIRMQTKEQILLDKPIFRIGKEKSYVDYFVGDNTAVSRSHANIITRDGRYFIEDTNSTNHTFVNGQMIVSNVETEIFEGAQIRLGNEEFEFKFL